MEKKINVVVTIDKTEMTKKKVRETCTLLYFIKTIGAGK